MLGYYWDVNQRKQNYGRLKKTLENNIINKRELLIPDSSTAVAVAELIVFRIYGKENITRQRPYEVYLIDHYWVLTGTLPKVQVGKTSLKGWVGGTFLIILEAQDNNVLRIIHGK